MQITYAGHSAVFVEIQGIKIAIDPWLEGNPLCPQALKTPSELNYIVLTHGHSDHAGDAVRVQKVTSAKVIATYELAMLLIKEGIPAEQVIPMNKGGSILLDQTTIRLTDAFHSSSYDTKDGPVYAGEACGVVIQSDNRTLYHAGDTSLFSDMRLIGELYKPDIALLPIGDRFTMGPKEAALAASWIMARVTLPIHYNTFNLLTGSYSEFASECVRLNVQHAEMKIGNKLEV